MSSEVLVITYYDNFMNFISGYLLHTSNSMFDSSFDKVVLTVTHKYGLIYSLQLLKTQKNEECGQQMATKKDIST